MTQSRLEKILNKGTSYGEEQINEPALNLDDRFMRIFTTKGTLEKALSTPEGISDGQASKLLKSDTLEYEFSLVPFQECNYLPFNSLASLRDSSTNDIIQYGRPTLNNFITNSYYKSEHGKIRFDYLKDKMFIAQKSKPTDINDPVDSYSNYFFENISKKIPKDQYNSYRNKTSSEILVSVYVIKDPVFPSNNGTIKLLKMKKSLFENIKTKQSEENKKLVNKYAKQLKIIENDPTKEKEVNELYTKIENSAVDIFNPKDKVTFQLDVKFLGSNFSLDEAKTLYDNVVLFVGDDNEPVLPIPPNRFSLGDYIEEMKEKYVNKTTRDNLSRLNFSNEMIFEYKATYDLYQFVKHDPLKLDIFNNIRKYNVDEKIVTEENYTPTKSLIKGAVEEFVVEETVSAKVIEKHIVEEPAPVNNRSFVGDLDDLDDDELPF